MAAALGTTKMIAPATSGSVGWQHAMLQSIDAFRPRCSQPAIGASFAELVSPEPFFGACPCSGHIAPSQQAMPAACKAKAHAGAHSSITATKHTHAPSLLPGALESWRILFIIPNSKSTRGTAVRKFNLLQTSQTAPAARGTPPSNNRAAPPIIPETCQWSVSQQSDS
jgi:hypothetical protein